MVVPNHDGLPDRRGGNLQTYDATQPVPIPFATLPAGPFHRMPIPRTVFGDRATTGHYEDVKRFCILAGNQPPEGPKVPDSSQAELCAKLILEEAMETIAALGVEVRLMAEHSRHDPVVYKDLFLRAVKPADLVEVVDGCCDTRVVSTFTLVMCGVTDGKPQALVDANNLGKFDPALGGKRCELTGKWLKPPGYPKPDLAAEIQSQKAAANRRPPMEPMHVSQEGPMPVCRAEDQPKKD